jgi:hypothetical protein
MVTSHLDVFEFTVGKQHAMKDGLTPRLIECTKFSHCPAANIPNGGLLLSLSIVNDGEVSGDDNANAGRVDLPKRGGRTATAQLPVESTQTRHGGEGGCEELAAKSAKSAGESARQSSTERHGKKIKWGVEWENAGSAREEEKV